MTTRNVTEVILTRLETHAMKLEIYNDMLAELLSKHVQTKGSCYAKQNSVDYLRGC